MSKTDRESLIFDYLASEWEVIHVLHVDDETGFLKGSKQILELHGQFQVDSASSVEEALAKMKKNKYNAVVSDYQMPIKDGLQFLRELREKGNNIPFILFTGKGREEVAIQALNLGANYYVNKLGKPDTIYGELAHVIKQVVNQNKAENRLGIERERLQTVTTSMNAGLAVISKDFRILWANDHLKTEFGDNYKGKKCFALINNLKSPCAGCVVNEIFEKGSSQVVHEQLVKGPDGQDIWLEITVTPIKDVDGNINAALELVIDITERKKVQTQLRDSEERFRQLFSSMPSGVAVYEAINNGEDFVFKDFNEAAERIEKLSRKNVVGKSVTELFPGVKKFGLFDVFQRVYRTGVPEFFPTTFYRDSRESGWRENWVYKLPNNDVVAIFNDVTEHKKAEAQLKNSQKQLEAIILNAPLGIATSDSKMVFLTANEAFCRILGYSENELKKITFREITHPDDAKGSSELMEQLISGDIPFFTQEKRYIRKNGTIINGKVTVSALRDQGKPELFIAELEDITERKKAEDKLKESEEKFRTIFEGASDGIAAIDPATMKVVFANPALVKILGFPMNKVVGSTILDYVPKDEIAATMEKFQNGVSGKRDVFRDLTVLRQDNTRIYVDVTSKFLTFGKQQYLISFVRNVTEQKTAHEALLESEKKYREMINAMNDTALVIDFDLNIIDANTTAVKVLGYSMEELLSMKVTEIDAILTEEHISGLAKKMKTREMVFETMHTTKDGKTFPVEISASHVTYNGKKAILSIARDITERKRAEEKNRASEERLRLLVENAPIAIYMNDVNGKFIDGNRYAEKLTGYKREELIGRNMLDVNLFPESQFPRIIEGMKANARGEKTGPDELELRKKDGSIIVIENVSIPVNKENEIVVIGIARDITEGQKLEKALRESEERFKQVAENAAEWIWEVEASGLYTYSSPAVENLLGYKPKELVGKKHFYDLFPSEEQESLKKTAFSAFKEKQSIRGFVNQNVHKNGNVVWLSTSGVPIVDNEGKLVGYRGADVDITDKKRAEDAIEKAVNELEKVIEKLGVVGKATRHDARNKLSIIANNIYLAKSQLAENNRAREYLTDAESAINQIEDIFSFAANYERIGVEELSSVNVGKNFEEAAMMFSGLGGTKFENECQGLMLLADSQLRQLFYNLIDNSMRHGKTVTKIRLFYEENEENLKLIYEDNGVGIPENEKERIFKEGYGNNTGLGLYLIQKMCEAYGWTIQETGKLGKGAQFTIIIPTSSYKICQLALADCTK